MHQAISLTILIVAMLILYGKSTAVSVSHGNWGEPLGLFVSPVLLFFVVQAVIFFGMRLLRKKVEHTFTTSRANYVSLVIALLAVFGQLSMPS
ncbi:hypothetical protein [Bradyrhizobium prioriisuperbiae]|uniref:hypothetical protein n=1 Tax=Bradyrhizobium prioriisuperbiae TaxID=2854389 RepID=UPI0028E58FC9|nr:hypothetical protein [Bradyrhizobium prioritasuperba]